MLHPTNYLEADYLVCKYLEMFPELFIFCYWSLILLCQATCCQYSNPSKAIETDFMAQDICWQTCHVPWKGPRSAIAGWSSVGATSLKASRAFLSLCLCVLPGADICQCGSAALLPELCNVGCVCFEAQLFRCLKIRLLYSLDELAALQLWNNLIYPW